MTSIFTRLAALWSEDVPSGAAKAASPAEPATQSRIMRVTRSLRRGLALAWAASPRAVILYSVLGAVNAALSPLVVLLGARLVDQIARAQRQASIWDQMLPIVAGLWVATALHRAVSSYLVYGRMLFVRRVELEAERQLFAQAVTLDMRHFDDPDWHNRLARAKRDLSWRPGDLTWSVLGLSANLVTLVLMAGLLASMHYLLVVLGVAAAVASLVLERNVTTRSYEFFYRETPEERERQYLGDLLVEAKAAKEVCAYGLADYVLGRRRAISDALLRRREDIYRSGTRVSLLSGLATGTALALAYLFVASQGVAGTIGPGGVVLVIGTFTSVSATLNLLSGTLVAIEQHSTFLEDYFSFLAIRPAIAIPATPQVMPDTPIASVEFDHITFTYPGGTESAIDGLDLRIRQGELVALVGENGMGKSTLVKLLLRFYDVDRGAVRVGGIDVRAVDPAALRSRIGVLFQDYAMYELSVRENVIMGRPGAAVDDARVADALRDANSEGLLKKLPRGLDSKVGRLFEGGHNISGGEWQRLALARLMYRDADIWVLDEPTASLDPEAEAAIFAELKANLRGRIGLVISHRFSTVRIADRIAVIAGGRIAEIGSHEELLAARGRYAQLFELQAAGYR